MDPTALRLIRYITEGWPDHKSQVDEAVKIFFDIRDSLSYEDNMIFKGQRAFIPNDMRPFIKKKLHASHNGLETMMRRARETVYWPGMIREIKDMADGC